MATSVVMPALEMAQETGKLVSWLKKEGEQVRKGEMLLEVETDKAVVEVEAQADGMLGGVTARVGDVVPVGQTIAWLLKPGEAVPAGSGQAQTGRKMDTPAVAAAISVSAAAPASVAGARISPKARRLAREHGIDISRLKGSGPSGEILADDILKAAAAVASGPTGAVGGPKGPPLRSEAPGSEALRSEALRSETSVGSGLQTRPGVGGGSADLRAPTPIGADLRVHPAAAADVVSSIGRIMAERTTQSWTTVPHFFVARDVDATRLNAARQWLMPAIEKSHGIKLTHTDLMVAAVGRALRQHPRMNGSWAGDRITINAEVNVALAMAVENAVVTAVIRNADRAPIGDIAKQRKELSERARANRLQPADISGATFTISNLGMFGVDAFTAIIVPPQAGILAVGAIADRVVAVDGMMGVRPMMTLTLSSDHRVVDGARAAAFLKDVVDALSEPASWLGA